MTCVCWHRGKAEVYLQLISTLGARRGWTVGTTNRPLQHLERPGTHCTGWCVDPQAGLDGHVKSGHTGILSSHRPARRYTDCAVLTVRSSI